MSLSKKRHSNLVAALAVLAAAAVLAVPAAAESWEVDQAHSEVSFSVKHFFTPVTGKFTDYDVSLDYNADDPTKSSVSAKIEVASIDTGNERRDNHLRSADWFEVESHPDITFKSTSVRAGDDGQLIATGPLTIKGISQEVELTITPLGIKDVPEPMQQMIGAAQVASFRATTAIDRNDFEVGVGDWAGTLVVGDNVEIEILVEAQR